MQTRVGCVIALATMRECRCDYSLLVLRALAWKGTGGNKHSSIFFPANLLHKSGMCFSLWISQQTKTIVTAEQTMKNSIWQFQQSPAGQKNVHKKSGRDDKVATKVFSPFQGFTSGCFGFFPFPLSLLSEEGNCCSQSLCLRYTQSSECSIS